MNKELSLDSPVRYLKGVGPARSCQLKRLNVETVEDLLYFFPRRYEDRRALTSLADLRINTYTSVLARIVAIEKRITRRKGLDLTQALITDGSTVATVIWFGRKGLERLLMPGVQVALYGRVESRNGAPQLTNPEFEVILQDGKYQDVGKIVPVYPTTSGLNEKWLRRLVSRALDACLDLVRESLPEDLRVKHDLIDLKTAIGEMHYPGSVESWKASRKRLAFDELFFLQVGLALRRRQFQVEHGAPVFNGEGSRFRNFIDKIISFELTSAQKRVIDEICGDLFRDVPMNRLLQGDVGSGKTVVAVAAMLKAVDNDHQAAFMVPTEVLAHQHYYKLCEWLDQMGISTVLLTGSLPVSEKRKRLEMIANGRADVIVGTHALLQEEVSFERLGLVVIDEQHRFGVLQRSAIRAKGKHPHVLVMTATPIPRTLALSVYGDLAVSFIDELPEGRKAISTRWIRHNQLPRLYEFILEQVASGRQVYWVCPVIEESEAMAVTSLLARFEELKTKLAGLKIAMLHGRLPSAEKEAIMADFAEGQTDVLVATTVIEVGVDVSNASLMVIENADRFGLSQLHQLRGRVGRGEYDSTCVLIGSPTTVEGKRRLEAMCTTINGFKIAEVDMKLRGPGEVCGLKQHGVTDFRVADLIRDGKLLATARDEAQKLVNIDPDLEDAPLLRESVFTKLGGALRLVETG